MPYVIVGCRGLLVLVFAAAAVGKLLPSGSFAAFRDSIRAAGLLPPSLASPVAVGVVAGEVGQIPLLLVPETAPLGAAAAGLLLAGFVGFIGLTMRRGTALRCNCFGQGGSRLGPRHLWRNGFLLLTVAGAAVPVEPGALHDPAGLAFAAVAAATAAVLVIRLDDVVDAFGAVAASR